MKRQELYVQLISELANYLLHGNPKKMVISLHMEADGFHIAAIDDRPRTDSEIAEIEHSLMIQQRPELASYYGTMVGHDLLGTAISCIMRRANSYSLMPLRSASCGVIPWM